MEERERDGRGTEVRRSDWNCSDQSCGSGLGQVADMREVVLCLQCKYSEYYCKYRMRVCVWQVFEDIYAKARRELDYSRVQ